MPKQKMSLEKLAGMVKRGFDSIDKRFDSVDKRFESIDKRFDKVDTEIKELKMADARIERKLDKVVERQDEQGGRIEVLEKQIA